METRVRPFLMFHGNATEAISFYSTLLPESRVQDMVRYGAGESGVEGSVKRATVSLAGQTIMCMDSPVRHEFGFTPAFSLFVDCASEDEIERLSAALTEGGMVLMPLGTYGFSRRYAWINDRFGLSWQLNLP